jgi:hypothetical protein
MTPEELAGMILKTLNVFDFLQFVDETYEKGDPESRALVERFFWQRHGSAPSDMPGVLPFAQLPTTLPMLTITVCFASSIKQDGWNEVGFSIKPEYQLKYYHGDDDQPAVATVEAVIRTIRNATAHLPDFIADSHQGRPNVSFETETGLVSFYSRSPRSRVKFSTGDGFISFLTDYLRAIRRLVTRQRQAHSPGRDEPGWRCETSVSAARRSSSRNR